jgi:hypothetical protein
VEFVRAVGMVMRAVGVGVAERGFGRAGGHGPIPSRRGRNPRSVALRGWRGQTCPCIFNRLNLSSSPVPRWQRRLAAGQGKPARQLRWINAKAEIHRQHHSIE